MSTDNATSITPCARDKKGVNGAREDIAAKQLTLQIEDLSIEKKAGDVTLVSTNTNNTVPDNITTCAACGKGGDKESMNICNKCKMVHYCNAACKKKHKSKHKKKCDRRVAELHDEALFEDHPPNEDCPICMIPLPLETGKSTYYSCCGKHICDGCIYTMMKEEVRKEKKNEELGMCAFCRTLRPSSDEEEVKQYKNLMEKGNAMACKQLACYYANGTMGMRQDWVKANELWLKAGELGCAQAYFNLGSSYYHGMGVETDKKKAEHYWELAAMNGNVDARHNLGVIEGIAGNYERAMKHFMVAARAGNNKSLDKVKQGFMRGFVTKDEYGNALRAYQERQDEMKSDTREAAAREPGEDY